MKKANQKKKQSNTTNPTKASNAPASKEVKLPLIQSNLQKGNLKEPKEKNLPKNDQKNKNNLKEIPPQMPNIPLTRGNPKNLKSLSNTNLSQNSNKSKKKKTNNSIKDENKLNNEADKKIPKFTEGKLSEIKEQRKQRLKQEKKDEEKQIEIYEKIIEEYKNSSKEKRTKKSAGSVKITEEDPKIIISSKKAQNILEEGGMFDAYKHVLAQLCKNGLPSGNVFEYASYVVKNYEKKWKEKNSKMMKDKIDKYYEKKQKEMNENDKEIKIVNKSLEHRDELKFIQNLDKSRSGRNVVPKVNKSLPKSNRFSYMDNYDISFFQTKKNKQFKIINNENEQNNNNINTIKLKESSVENNNKIMKDNHSNTIK